VEGKRGRDRKSTLPLLNRNAKNELCYNGLERGKRKRERRRHLVFCGGKRRKRGRRKRDGKPRRAVESAYQQLRPSKYWAARGGKIVLTTPQKEKKSLWVLPMNCPLDKHLAPMRRGRTSHFFSEKEKGGEEHVVALH